jgi:hypothetical protein
LQENPSKTKEKGLHFLAFPWRNRAFSMGYRRKNKKILSPLCSRPRLWARSRNSISLPFSHRQAWRGVEFFKWEQYSTDSVFRKAATTFFGFNDAVTGALPSRGQVVTTPSGLASGGKPCPDVAMFRASKKVIGRAAD